MPSNRHASARAKPARPDWEAIERDYRTGKFTLRELEKLHGRSAAQICRRASANGWTKDLRDVVRQATTAALIRDLAASAATSAQADTTHVVLAAAQVQRDVVVRHRQDVSQARVVVTSLMTELGAATLTAAALDRLLSINADELGDAERAEVMASFRELVRLHSRIGSMQKLADSLQRLHALERRAFGIGDDEGTSNPLDTMSERELEAELARLTQQVQGLDARVKASEADAPVPGDGQARPAVH